MRKLIFLAFMTLDGIMQSDDGPEVDTSGGFTYSGGLLRTLTIS